MRKQDKKKNMEKVNKLFQERNNGVNKSKVMEKEVVTYTKVVDIYPELSRILD